LILKQKSNIKKNAHHIYLPRHMNFLERLAAEWYAYNGFFVRTNIKFARGRRGGYGGEMDVIAYEPSSHKLVHVETSTDSNTLSRRKEEFSRKFSTARREYLTLFPYKGDFEQIAVIGLSRRPPKLNISGVKVKSIPQFISEVSAKLRTAAPWKEAVSETYPILRAIQFAVWYGNVE